MEYISLGLSLLSFILLIVILIIVIKNKKKDSGINDNDLKKIRESMAESVSILSNSTANLLVEKNSVILNNVNLRCDDIINNIKLLNDNINNITKEFNTLNEKLNKNVNEHFEKLNTFMVRFVKTFSEGNNRQKEEIMNRISLEMEKLNSQLKISLNEFKKDTSLSIGKLSDTVAANLKEIRDDNNNKLDKINNSVNEKLEKTLENKLKDSFENVIKQIGNVNTAIGEIKGLASDVGSLKNVLTNVKTKGIVGEVILGNIIKEFLTVDQYLENVSTKANSSERVEFAIKLPGSKDETILLPVDSKFPYEAYSNILNSNNPDEIKNYKKELRTNLLKYAKDVALKYIDVPNTTDFAIIFLPLEGLYLEALNMGLFEEIQRKYKVNITGPTTLSAFINSLNMGFKSLMIQKRSADVFKLLAAVKTEFGKFADVLSKTQKKFTEASLELDKLVGTRTRMINYKLKEIDSLADDEAKSLIENDIDNI